MNQLTRQERKAKRTLLRHQRQDLRRQLKVQRREQEAAYRAQPAVVKARARRRQRRMLVLAIILLIILLLLRLDCSAKPSSGKPKALPIAQQKQEQPPKKAHRRKPKKLKGKVQGSARSAMAIEPMDPPLWLPQFRLQVSSRSPRLAACLIGTDWPGAMRWSALVHAQSGRVTESVVEPVFRGVSLDEDQLACLIKGLTEQPYVLDEPDPQAAARRVSLIFEF